MAQKKSKADIFRSEKYMDDAMSSAFLNLHKAAKRKSEYIWATQKFSSLDTIWGDPIEIESDKISRNTSKVSKNESKILKPQYCGESNLVGVMMADNVPKIGLHHEQTTKVPANRKVSSDTIWGDPVELESDKVQDDKIEVSQNSKYEPKFLKQNCSIDNKQSTSQVIEYNPVGMMSDNVQKSGLHPEQHPKVPESRKASLLQNFGDFNKGKENKSKYSNPANKVLNADEQNEVGVKRETLKRNGDVDCRISDRRYEWRQKISQRKQNCGSIGNLKTEDHSQCSVGDAENTSRITFENCKFNVASNAGKNKGVKSHNDETEFQSSCKLNYSDKPQKGKTTERVKRKRYMSSSVNSLFPEQKHFSIQKQDTADKRSIMLKTMLQLKILKGEKVFDFTLELADFNRMKKRFPKLEEILPEIDGEEKELNYSADAVKIVLGFLHNLRYPAQDERTAVEVLAASKSFGMRQFHDEFKEKFSENLNRNNVHFAYGAAVHYNLVDICDAYKSELGDDLPNNRPYRPRKCYISVSRYIEPREFCIPSKISTSTLDDNFDRDITNEIRFKAIAGSFIIKGFHILLNIGNETDSINLEFFYVVRNFKRSFEEELKVRKPLRRNIVVHLKRSLVVNENETAEIVLESSIKPYFCFAVQENNFVGRRDDSQFSLNITSNYKVKNSNEKRFLIGKLLYYPKT